MLQVIWLHYRIIVVYLWRVDMFLGSNLCLATDGLIVPLERSKARESKYSAKENANQKVSHFPNSFDAKDVPSRKESEPCHMTSDWDVDWAIYDAREDLQWEANK